MQVHFRILAAGKMESNALAEPTVMDVSPERLSTIADIAVVTEALKP